MLADGISEVRDLSNTISGSMLADGIMMRIKPN